MRGQKKKKFFIWALGCQMNKSDSERVAGVLIGWGYEPVASEDRADLIVVMACSVRQSAIDRIYGRSRQWQERRGRGQLLTILTGCFLPADAKKLADRFDFVLPIKDLAAWSKIMAGKKLSPVKDYFCLKPLSQSKIQAYVPIMTGCNNFCSYCVVPYTRGREISRPVEEIIKEFSRLIMAGYKEITLLGQNVNSYRSDAVDFPRLLKKLDQIKGDYWLRFVTSHPKDLSPELLKTLARGKHLTPYLHLPAQAGDDQVLRKMNRRYTIKRYLSLLKQARKLIPQLMVSTDIIVGFPGETKQQFNRTVELFQQAKFDMAYIAQYSPRAGTVASRLKDNVSHEEKKRREKVLTEILQQTALKNNQKFIGQTVRVLAEKVKNKRLQGKNPQFKTVTFSGPDDLVGKFVEVKIIAADSWGLMGVLD